MRGVTSKDLSDLTGQGVLPGCLDIPEKYEDLQIVNNKPTDKEGQSSKTGYS